MTGDPSHVPNPAAALLTRDASALITSLDDAMLDVLGWRPDQMVGRASTEFIHPEDQPSAVAAWFTMLRAPGETRAWRGRYHAADGAWVWVETVNVNRLDDPDNPVVTTEMTRVAPAQVGHEEELRARRQLLSRLADALPVGVFQIDADRRITFTNDRFHAILGSAPTATAAAQFATVVPDDRIRLDAVLSAVLADEPVDDLDIRLRPVSETPGTLPERVCVLAMRPLTDGTGAVTGAIGCLSDITERVHLRRELEIRASVDGLTSCLNRRSTLELLVDTLARHADSGAPTAIMYVDVDGFKAINDSHGHAAGDRVLEIAARRLRAAVRDADRVGRLGGDEFLVVCPDVESTATALEIGKRLARTLTTDVTVATATIHVGVAWSDEPIHPDVFVARADAAMYASKTAGRSEATLFF